MSYWYYFKQLFTFLREPLRLRPLGAIITIIITSTSIWSIIIITTIRGPWDSAAGVSRRSYTLWLERPAFRPRGWSWFPRRFRQWYNAAFWRRQRWWQSRDFWHDCGCGCGEVKGEVKGPGGEPMGKPRGNPLGRTPGWTPRRAPRRWRPREVGWP